MSEQVFRCQHRVSYSECTVGNHIYYSRYLDLLERARGGFFRCLGKTFLEWQQEGTIFPVIECRLKYHAPARYDDLLTMEVRVVLAKGVRLNFAHRVLGADGRLLVEAETDHVCASVEEKPKRIPQGLLSMLADWGGRPEAGQQGAS